METAGISDSEFTLARAVALSGFGGRRSGETLTIGANGTTDGSLFGGAADERIIERSSKAETEAEGFDFFKVQIGDQDAVKAGLACGGTADILIQRSSALPDGVIESLKSRDPVALATVVDGKSRGSSVALMSEAFRTGGKGLPVELRDILSVKLRNAIARRTTASSVEEIDGLKVVFETFSPPTELLIVGESDLAHAIVKQAQLLGWDARITDDEAMGTEVAKHMGENDALVVLSHDHSVGIPIIAAAFQYTALTYIGGLGSRHTQAKRSELLRSQGSDENSIARIHGPVGLNLGSKTPEETALAICAEILMHLTGRSGISLKDSDGPING